jgi:hypothetical protein
MSTFNVATHNPTRTKSTIASTPSSGASGKHWSQVCHETVLTSSDAQHSIELSLAGGAENGQFIYLNESISILKSKPYLTIVKGSKIDIDEIVLEIEQHAVAGCTLADVELLLERFSSNGKQIVMKTVKSGRTSCFRLW